MQAECIIYWACLIQVWLPDWSQARFPLHINLNKINVRIPRYVFTILAVVFPSKNLSLEQELCILAQGQYAKILAWSWRSILQLFFQVKIKVWSYARTLHASPGIQMVGIQIPTVQCLGSVIIEPVHLPCIFVTPCHFSYKINEIDLSMKLILSNSFIKRWVNEIELKTLGQNWTSDVLEIKQLKIQLFNFASTIQITMGN